QAFGRSGPLVLSRVASAALTFGLPLVLVRVLDPHSFGTYKQFFLVAQTLLLVGQLGLTQSLYYFLPRGAAQRGAYVAQVVALLAGLGALLGIAIWTLSPLLSRWLASPDLVGLRIPLAVYSAAMLAAAPLEATLVCEGHLRKAAFAYTASDVLRAAAIVLAAAVFGESERCGRSWAQGSRHARRRAGRCSGRSLPMRFRSPARAFSTWFTSTSRSTWSPPVSTRPPSRSSPWRRFISPSSTSSTHRRQKC
ncbi:MAG: hypothetical protein E6J82_07125, partial [Deltaproteobacteria bacterium]